MGKVTTFTITCGDKQSPVYRPGDTIFGKVTFTVSGEISVNAVRLYCYGSALTKWSTSDQRLTQRDSRAKEEYMAKQYTFYEGGEKKFTEGTYSYNYRFELPRDNIPSSFEEELGAIRYWLKFCIHQPFLSFDFDRYKPFTVLANLDVNEYTKVVSRKDSKTISKALGLGNAGNLYLSASLDRSAYCPGETMLITLEANNQSTKDLGIIRIRLVQRAWFSIGTENDTRSKVVASFGTPAKLLKQDKLVMTKHAFHVPAISPTTVERSCHIIDVKYSVQVDVEVPFGFDLTVNLPVKIGTIPLGAKKVESKKQHNDCKNYNRVGFTKSITYKSCTSGVSTCSKTDSDLPFPYISYTPLTAVVTPSPTTAKPTTANTPQKTVKPTTPTANAAQRTTPQAAKTAHTTAAPATPAADTAHWATPTAPLPPPDMQGFYLYPIASGGAMAMPFPNEAPPSYNSIYNTPSSPISSTSTTTDNPPAKGNPQITSAQNVPKKTPSAAATLHWKGATIGAIFPDTYLPQMKEFLRKNPKMLDANGGKVLGIFEKFQMSPSEATSALFVIFNSEDSAAQWAEHLHGSNPAPELQICLAVNCSSLAADVKNVNLFPYVHVVMSTRDPVIHRTKEQAAQLSASTKALFPSLRIEYGGKTIITAMKVKLITGDWTERTYSPENLGVSISLWPTKELYDAYINDLKSRPEYEKINEIVKVSVIASASTSVFKSEE